MEYRDLGLDELTVGLFDRFVRHQEVSQCWRKVNGEWVLRDIAFVEEWGRPEFEELVRCLRNTAGTGGVVVGVFGGGDLAGFASLESRRFGPDHEYLQLSSIYVSHPMRGRGVGKELFTLICDHARRMGALKLCISAHSSKETQAFYRKLGCIETVWMNQRLVDLEPCDCQMEYPLARVFNHCEEEGD